MQRPSRAVAFRLCRRACDWARTRALRPLFDELSRLHYDPAYKRGGEGLYRRLEAARMLPLASLGAPALAAAAQGLAAAG